MTVAEMRDMVLAATNAADTAVMGDKNTVVRNYISSVQQDWAKRTKLFTKSAHVTTRTSGGEDAQSKYQLTPMPGDTTGGLPYKPISVTAVSWDGVPLTVCTKLNYLSAKARNNGDALYDDPKMFWIENNVLHIWPCADTAKELRIFYSAYPKHLTDDTDDIAISDEIILLNGVMSLVYNQLKDSERAFYYKQIYDRAIKEQLGDMIIMDNWSPLASADGMSVTDGEFGGVF